MGVGSPSPGAWGADGSDTQGGVDIVRVKFTAGTAGAVPAFPLDCSQGVVSVAKSGTTGQYDIVFQNAEFQTVGFYGDNLQATFSAAGACYAVRIASSVSAGTTTIQFCNGSDGTAVYLASGDKATLVFERQRYKSQ
jgi:hypothetical protein